MPPFRSSLAFRSTSKVPNFFMAFCRRTSSLPAPTDFPSVQRVCEYQISVVRSTRWRVTNNSLSSHLRSIEARGGRVHIGPVPLLLAAAVVTIRIYNYAAVPPDELAPAREHADH